MIKIYNVLAFVSIFSISNLMSAQESMEVCAPMYVCQNSLTPLECAGCNANTFFGTNVVEINGVYYFDSDNLTPNQYLVNAQCNFGTPQVNVTVLPSQLTINGQPYYNDTLQYCLPSNGYQLGIANLQSGYSVSWSPSYGLNNPNSSTPIANPSVATTYTVTVTMPDGYTSCSNQITLIPVQGYNLSLGISNANICAGQSISLSPSILPASGGWVINSSTGQSWTSQNPLTSIYPSQSSVYTMSVPNNSCTNSVQASVSVHPLPVGSVTPLQEKCAGDQFYLTAQTSTTNQVSWYDQSGQLLGVGPTISQFAQSSQTYNCYITNSFGCSINIPVPLTVNPNCCVNDSPLPSNVSYTISTTTTWNGVNYTLTNDITVLPGVSFKVINSTLKFSEFKGIILQEGADLDVQFSTLTNLDNCPHAWKGISVSHNSLYASSVDVTNIGISNSKITHAYIGLFASSLPPSGFGTGISYGEVPWAKITCKSTDFFDNVQDMRIYGYGPNFQLGQIDLEIHSCKFEVQTNFPSYLTHNTYRIDLRYNAKGKYIFDNCVLSNNRYDFLTSQQELIGIYSELAKYKIQGSPTLQNTQSSSRFTGFTRGVKSIGNSEIWISNTDFSCFRDILLSGNNQICKIDSCRLLNLPSGYWNFSNQNAPYISNDLVINEPGIYLNNVAYGVYLNFCSGGIEVKDNYFNMNKAFNGYPSNSILSSASNATEHGLILNDCHTSSGEIARNTFTYMKRAVKCQGQNKTNQFSGVKFICNNFSGNGRDIVILPQTQSPLIGVPTQQKNSKDPRNSFTQSAETFDDIQNLTPQFIYFYLQTTPSNLINSEINNVSPYSVIFTLDCNTLTLNGDLLQNKSTYSETWGFWNETKNGGNSADLISIIESADFQSMIEELYPVIQASPYLSLDMILKSIKNQNIPNYLLAQILSYNSSSLSNLDLKEELDNRVVSLSEYEKALVYQGVNIWSSKDYLFGQLNYLEEEHQRMLNDIRLTPDSLLSQHGKDSILDLYVEPSLFYSDFRNSIIDLTMNGDYNGAESLYNQYAANYDLLPSQKLELNQVIAVASDLSTTSLSVKDYYDQHPELTPLSKNLVSHFYGDTLYHHVDFILDELETRSMTQESISEFKMESRIYPNPCSESFFSVSVPLGNYRMEINNEIGQNVYDKMCNFGQTVFVIDVHEFVNGLYSVKLTNLKTNQIELHKLIIQK